MKNYVNNMKLCKKWIENNFGNGYAPISNIQPIPYHEVTGYFIPTLRDWGFHNKAMELSEYLVNKQLDDGGWNPHGEFSIDKNVYVFDVAQIIDGLSEFDYKYSRQIEKATTWIMSRFQNGRFNDLYVHPDVKTHCWVRTMYCLQKCGVDITELKKAYMNDEMYSFDVLSHFYGYAFEGAARMGWECNGFINEIKKNNGLLPERKGYSTYCTVGLSQMALGLFLCGELEMGMKALEFVSSFQNDSGGFYGSNGKYFPQDEISWGVKFYMDAVRAAQTAWFKKNIKVFVNKFEDGEKDKRLIYVKENIIEGAKVLDVGCGGGRYINSLNCDRYACDIADASKYINGKFDIGSCLRLPYKDNTFDMAITAECLEHSVFHDNAIDECLRVVKKGGTLLIIDKDIKINFSEIHFGEEWLDFNHMKEKYNAEITEIRQNSLSYPFYGAKIIKI